MLNRRRIKDTKTETLTVRVTPEMMAELDAVLQIERDHGFILDRADLVRGAIGALIRANAALQADNLLKDMAVAEGDNSPGAWQHGSLFSPGQFLS